MTQVRLPVQEIIVHPEYNIVNLHFRWISCSDVLFVFVYTQFNNTQLPRKRRRRQHRLFLPFNITAVENDIAVLKVIMKMKLFTILRKRIYHFYEYLIVVVELKPVIVMMESKVNTTGREVCKERIIWPACLPR